MKLPFIKMNGAGNDFVILRQPVSLSMAQIQTIAHRKNKATFGCDQLIVLRPSEKADIFMSIYNADGSEVDACGNATRCVATLLEQELGRLPVTIETNAGILHGIKKEFFEGREYVLVDMGKPKFNWQDIPLAMPIELAKEKVKQHTGLNLEPYFISMGNPHIVFFVPSENINPIITGNTILEIGHRLETYKEVFPKGVNVSIAEFGLVRDNFYAFHSQVWERGAGHTKACGTAACAMQAAAHVINPAVLNAAIWFENSLQMVSTAMTPEGHILLGGPVEIEFTGNLVIK